MEDAKARGEKGGVDAEESAGKGAGVPCSFANWGLALHSAKCEPDADA